MLSARVPENQTPSQPDFNCWPKTESEVSLLRASFEIVKYPLSHSLLFKNPLTGVSILQNLSETNEGIKLIYDLLAFNSAILKQLIQKENHSLLKMLMTKDTAFTNLFTISFFVEGNPFSQLEETNDGKNILNFITDSNKLILVMKLQGERNSLKAAPQLAKQHKVSKMTSFATSNHSLNDMSDVHTPKSGHSHLHRAHSLLTSSSSTKTSSHSSPMTLEDAIAPQLFVSKVSDTTTPIKTPTPNNSPNRGRLIKDKEPDLSWGHALPSSSSLFMPIDFHQTSPLKSDGALSNPHAFKRISSSQSSSPRCRQLFTTIQNMTPMEDLQLNELNYLTNHNVK